MKEQMNVKATATWNNEKGTWEVEIFFEENYQNMYGVECHRARKYQCEVSKCDELVIPTALLEMDGLTLF